MQQSKGETGKRPRLALQALQTPGTSGALGTPASLIPSTHERLQAPPSESGLSMYNRERGDKMVKDLESELSQVQLRCDRLQQELASKQDKITLLSAENKALKDAAMVPSSGATTLLHLNRQLDEQLRKALLLEQELAGAKQREAVSAQRLASLESLMDEHRAEQAKLMRDGEAIAARLRAELESARSEVKVAVQKADMAERVAQRRVEAEQEILKVSQAQLEEVRGALGSLQAELEQTRQRATRAEAEAAALRSSAQHVRLQLLEEELRAAREAAAVAQSAAAAAAGRLPAQDAAALGPHRSPGGQGRITGAGWGTAATEAIAYTGEVGDLPEAIRSPWAGLIKTLALPQGLPLASQAAEAVRLVTDLTEQVADLRAAVQSKDESMLQLRATASGSEAYAAELQSQLTDARSRLERALTAERVAERRSEAIEQERDALRTALSSPIAAARVENPASLSGRLLAGQQTAALEQLRDLNESLQNQVLALHQDVAAATAAADTQALTARTANARAEAAEQRLKQIEREADNMASMVGALQERLGRGEMIRSGGVRVLHLRHNPEAEARQEAREAAVTQLRAENEALRGQVAELEAAVVKLQEEQKPDDTVAPRDDANQAVPAIAPPALGSGVAIAVKDAEITVLRRKVEACEKDMSRLKAVFKERISVFREACYLMFGYRVDMTAEATAASDAAGAPTTFTLKPQHADDPAALLVFRYTGGGKMELVPNTFTRERMAREVETFVRKFNCISALTANLTMDNFQKQTVC